MGSAKQLCCSTFITNTRPEESVSVKTIYESGEDGDFAIAISRPFIYSVSCSRPSSAKRKKSEVLPRPPSFFFEPIATTYLDRSIVRQTLGRVNTSSGDKNVGYCRIS